MFNLFKKEKTPALKGLYILAFTPEKLETDPLRQLVKIAENMLQAKSPVFKRLMEKQMMHQTPIQIANVQFVALMHTPQTMQTALMGWLKKSYTVNFQPKVGENFFPHGMKDTQGKEAYILFYFDLS